MCKATKGKIKYLLPVIFLSFIIFPGYSNILQVPDAVNHHAADTVKLQAKYTINYKGKDTLKLQAEDSIKQQVPDSVLYKQRIFKAEELIRG